MSINIFKKNPELRRKPSNDKRKKRMKVGKLHDKGEYGQDTSISEKDVKGLELKTDCKLLLFVKGKLRAPYMPGV